jgi:hypothetical protein
MPWKECNIVEERLRFIARLLDGEKMAGLCRCRAIADRSSSASAGASQTSVSRSAIYYCSRVAVKAGGTPFE